MYRNGVILLIVLFCVACLISCGKKEVSEPEKSEFVRIETGENSPVFTPQKIPVREKFFPS